MDIPISLIGVAVSFIVTLLFLPLWIKKARKIDLVWEDMNKWKHPKNVAASGGLIVVVGFILGVLSYIALRTYHIGVLNNSEIFALLSVILLLGIVGIVDDLLDWKKGGLSNWLRIALAFIASIPLVVISAGVSTIAVPFFGAIEFGILYPLVLIPLGIAGATTTFNFLAGFNGLEAGQGILILSFLSYVAHITGNSWLAVAGLCMVSALVVFWLFNKNPAKVFPGDIMTWSVGALIASMAILGNFEKVAVIVFIPYFIEMILKSRGNLKKHSFGIPEANGNLKLPYGRIYGMTHFAIWFLHKFKKRVTENDVVWFIHLIQVGFILIAFLTM